MYLNENDFYTVIQNTPLVSIDLIIKNTQGCILLGKRNNRPAQGHWFVPGGRIRKDESLAIAFERLTLDELGQAFLISEANKIGLFEHFYLDSIFGEDLSTHYIVLAYEIRLNQPINTLPLNQHCDYRWFSIDKLLRDNEVHCNTKAYFEKS